MTRTPEPEILQIEVGLVQNFCTLLCDPASGTVTLCDPAFEVDRILRTVHERGLRVGAVLITHGHLDHIEGVPAVLARADVPVYVGAGEADAVAALCREAGVTPTLHPTAGGEHLRCGALTVEVLATPGHTRAGRSYYLPELGALLPGDTLFVGSCGRPMGEGGAAQLWRSLQSFAELPEETRVYPGHDYGPTPTSTLAWELSTNPYLRCPDAAAFVALCRRRLGA